MRRGGQGGSDAGLSPIFYPSAQTASRPVSGDRERRGAIGEPEQGRLRLEAQRRHDRTPKVLQDLLEQVSVRVRQ